MFSVTKEKKGENSGRRQLCHVLEEIARDPLQSRKKGSEEAAQRISLSSHKLCKESVLPFGKKRGTTFRKKNKDRLAIGGPARRKST